MKNKSIIILSFAICLVLGLLTAYYFPNLLGDNDGILTTFPGPGSTYKDILQY